MFCVPAQIQKPDDHDAVRCDGAGNGVVDPEGDLSGHGSLLLPDAGSDEFRAAKLWHLSAAVSSGDICVRDQI